jgi:hypothetical protein
MPCPSTPPTQRQKHPDLPHRHLAVRRRQLRAHIGVGPRRLQISQERLTPHLVTQMRLVRRLLAERSASANASRRSSKALYCARRVWVSRMAFSTTPSKFANAAWVEASAMRIRARVPLVGMSS